MAKQFELAPDVIDRLDKGAASVKEIETILESMKRMGMPTTEIEAVLGPAKQALEALGRLRK